MSQIVPLVQLLGTENYRRWRHLEGRCIVHGCACAGAIANNNNKYLYGAFCVHYFDQIFTTTLEGKYAHIADGED